MNLQNKLTLSAVKVIAAGDVGNKCLRATIILTPPAGGKDNEEDAKKNEEDTKQLARWPADVIQWLRWNRWNLKLEVRPAPPGGGDPCPKSQDKTSLEITATASAMQKVWSNQASTAWVDELWAQAFQISKASTKLWERLRKALNQATSQHDTLQLSKNGKASYVSPALQTDLSLFLECNRSLELCDSIAIADLKTREERVDRRLREVEYLLGAPQPNDGSPTPPVTGAQPSANGQSGVHLASRGSLTEKMRVPVDSCQKATRPENPVVIGCEQAELDCLGQVFYSLQSSPTLSRLFGLAIDVSFQASELYEKIGNAPFLYLSVGTSAFDTSHPPVLTLAEYRADTPAYFWPATRDESTRNYLPDQHSIYDLRQYHGVSVNTQESGKQRFELSCLDVRRATESAIDRQAIIDPQKDPKSNPTKPALKMTDEQLIKWATGELCKPAKDETSTQEGDPICKLSEEERRKLAEDQLCKLTEADLERLTKLSPLRYAAFARKTYHTAGFTILDRGRAEQADNQYRARETHQNQTQSNECIALDAADLITGYRIDVGVPTLTKQQANCIDINSDSNPFTWRGLMGRKVVYGVTGSHGNQIKRVAPHLFLESVGNVNPDLGWQKCLEDGYLGLTARLIPQENSTPDAYVEEAIFTWTGEPMGVLIAGQRFQKVKSCPTRCGRVVIAPDGQTDASRRIPFLRFGCHYRFGLRSVYPGGISLPLGDATSLYNDKYLKFALAVPASPLAQTQPAVQLRRFLRHERIDAPLLLLPEDAALRPHGPMGYESAARVVIRSVQGKVHDRQQPTVAQRVFIVPGVAHSLAGMHGVFDKITVKNPPEGLSSSRFGPSGVRRDRDRGGFPMVTSDHITGINGYPYASSRRITSGSLADPGDLVYSFGSHPQPNYKNPDYVPYYPDPAVRYFVIGVRFAGTDIYLQGDPCVIDAIDNGYNYPDTRPLVVTVQRTPAARPRSGFPRLNEVVTLPERNGRVAHLPTGASHIPGAVEALLTLAPGDDFEVDVWCIPEFESLAKQFALIESLAALALYRGKNQSQQVEPSLSNEFYSGLGHLLPANFIESIKSYLQQPGMPSKEVADWQRTATGPGGLTVPGPIVRKAVASALVEVLKRKPLDEIAAFRTLRATHATDVPFVPPRLVDAPKTNSGESRAVGLNRTTGAETNRYPFKPQGMIEFDWATTSSLELSADMASPSSDQMDNVQRGRAIRDLRFGQWPHHKDGCPFSPLEVYGFDVAPNGEVKLPETCGMTLYRLDDIPLPISEDINKAPTEPPKVPGNLLFDDLFAVTDNEPNLGTGKFTFQFTDGLARHLKLRVTAFSRHRDQMRTADPIAHDGKWLHHGEPLAAADASRASDCIPVWLNSCVRPAEPGTRTPTLTFRWSDEVPSQNPVRDRKKPGPIVHRTSRTVIIRIPIARPWFSSGEDERLGIVLWPPDFFSQCPEMFQKDEIWFKGSCKDENGIATQGRKMKLSNFQDEDLGPGGKFITRWGGDPTRFPAERLASSTLSPSGRTSLMPASAFLDLSQDSGTGFVPEPVSRVSMPIRVEESTGKSQNEKSGDIPTLDVSLLTYRPKFDISEEQWYVDVALAHPREAEPFVRLGLVRYQPHAAEDLQVSYPVVQWTQLLPRRTVEVQRSGLTVTIRVEGLATSPHDSLIEESFRNPHEVPLSSDEQERLPTTRMTARIIREASLPLGVATRSTEVFRCPGLHPATEIVFSERNTTYTKLKEEGIYEAVWKETLTLDKMDLKHASYFVIVEERDVRLPATYTTEPVSPDRAVGNSCNGTFDESLLVKSGHRFFAKIPL